MEQAYDRVQNHPSLSLWAKSNLGDMYGHDGRIKDAYNAYLQVLAKQPTHWHSWQGIAWVNYSNDGNIPEAKRILEFINTHNNNPLTKLLLAEIASYENQNELADTYTNDFYEEVSQTEYQKMYAKYLILLEAETLDLTDKALNRAIKERNARATPEVHDLVAWSHLKMGENQKALEIAQRHVEGKTSEPDVLHHLGMIYRANGNSEKAKAFLQEALEAEYELGPVTINSIKQELARL